MITAYASIETAVEAMKRGAADYLPKPLAPEQLELVIDRIAGLLDMENRLATLQEDLNRIHPEVSLFSRYSSMQRALELARQAAPSEAVVLSRGPSGTGKTVLARTIHDWSRRASRPFGVISVPLTEPGTP